MLIVDYAYAVRYRAIHIYICSLSNNNKQTKMLIRSNLRFKVVVALWTTDDSAGQAGKQNTHTTLCLSPDTSVPV